MPAKLLAMLSAILVGVLTVDQTQLPAAAKAASKKPDSGFSIVTELNLQNTTQHIIL